MEVEVLEGEEVCYDHGYAVREDDSRWNSLFAMLSGISIRIEGISSEINSIDSRLKKCEKIQAETAAAVGSEVETLKSQMAALKSVIETAEIDALAPPITELIQPAKCKEDLDALEEKALDEDYKNQLVSAVARIHGCNRIGEGATVSYQIIDFFFDRKFMVECSWSGESIKSGVHNFDAKIALSKYCNLIGLFHACVNVTDSTYTQNECVQVIRMCLKNSKRRLKANRRRKSAAQRKKKPTSEDLAVRMIAEKQLRRLQAVGVKKIAKS
ncbi:uncharacterized protein LOC126570737 [Anopheles aquasalis]|uniref:uncharacterized protein LOC126570737 n=1 Tax=Anopheles aquasalis TaxID=42839 RepID=UPI00215A1DA9|nr:uncharacterized protein LOC126570737 [Anopheles aquasalis]